MSNDNRDLRSLLTELHERLGQAKAVDPNRARCSRRWLRTSKERSSARRREAHRGRDEAPGARGKFEVEHPALAEAVRDVIDGLAKAGI